MCRAITRIFSRAENKKEGEITVNFNDRTKKIICICIAIAMVVPIGISVILTLLSL